MAKFAAKFSMKNMSKRLWLLFLLFPFWSSAQKILNDTVQNVYGPATTGYLMEKDVLLDDTLLHHPDTLIDGFHLMTLNHRNGLLWQDLGNEGTAAKNMVFKLPANSFTETGWTAFSQFYAPDIENVKYYNTRSPFTNMAYTQSGNGMSNLGFTHAQNISPYFNVAVNVNRIVASKQWSASTSEDRLVDHWDYTLSTNYLSKNKKYRFLGAFVNFNHKQEEQGGISVFEGLNFIPEADLSGDYNTNYQERLTGISTRERWNNAHIYHQFQLAKGVQLFHVFDYQRQKYFQRDTLISRNFPSGIYPDSVEAEKMKNYYFFNNIQNRFGFKGTFKGFKYSLGLTNRIYALNAVHDGETGNRKTEILVGGNAGYWFPDSTSYLDNEVYLGIGESPNVFIRSNLKIKQFDLGFRLISKPSYLLFNSFSSQVASWDNNFKNLTYTSFSGKINLSGQKAWFSPVANINLVGNHLYFDQNQSPQQLESTALLMDFDVNAGVSLKNWKVENRFILNVIGNKEVFRLPAVINNFNLEYHVKYAKVLDLYFGTDLYFRGAYSGDAYSPYLRSFYLQDGQNVWGYPVADVYTNFMIKRVKLAFSFNYLNKGVPTQGYYTTPDYLAMGRTFHLKVNWPLFD
ncbi:hypothetical protein AFM12_03150 [Jiulongibacter sediminis]|uniref:Porin n=2 Tax=Jiulongibacter sediminis TaxID=1605367 RepID=A0A0P7BXI6_9BACT|nr:hypothetical protein AFM12_03150 [Jiulongibacter sediminis]TBX26646.1 hypothetical protein TK44_03155 [Jiulongibacter sediminis]